MEAVTSVSPDAVWHRLGVFDRIVEWAAEEGS